MISFLRAVICFSVALIPCLYALYDVDLLKGFFNNLHHLYAFLNPDSSRLRSAFNHDNLNLICFVEFFFAHVPDLGIGLRLTWSNTTIIHLRVCLILALAYRLFFLSFLLNSRLR